jgi:hypothetical protein
MQATSQNSTELPEIFRISPLVRYTLYGLLLSLLLPLPFLMVYQHQTEQLPIAIVGVFAGWLALVGLLSQYVQVDEQGVQVQYAAWVPKLLVKGWALTWPEVKAIHSRPTSQGGRAHYFVSQAGNAYLLPMRIAGFAQFLRSVETYADLDTSKIKPLAQPWMYLILLGCVVLLLLVDLPIVLIAMTKTLSV